jgi:hypothetical protein
VTDTDFIKGGEFQPTYGGSPEWLSIPFLSCDQDAMRRNGERLTGAPESVRARFTTPRS